MVKLNAPHFGGADSGDTTTPRQDNPLHMQQALIFTRTTNFAEHTVGYLGRGATLLHARWACLSPPFRGDDYDLWELLYTLRKFPTQNLKNDAIFLR